MYSRLSHNIMAKIVKVNGELFIRFKQSEFMTTFKNPAEYKSDWNAAIRFCDPLTDLEVLAVTSDPSFVDDYPPWLGRSIEKQVEE